MAKFDSIPLIAKFRASRTSSVAALVLGADRIFLAEATRRSRQVQVVRMASAPTLPAEEFSKLNPKEQGARIAAALQELRFKGSAVVMGIPRTQAVLRTLTLPSTADPGELAAMVHFQISKELPFASEDAVIDFTLLPRIVPNSTDPDQPAASALDKSYGKIDVLAAAATRATVQQLLDLAQGAKLKLICLGLLPYANARFMSFSKAAGDDQAVALLSLGTDHVVIDIIVNGTLAFSRVGSIQHLDGHGEPSARDSREDMPADDEPFASRVAIEVVRSFHSYLSAEFHSPIEKILVAGSTGQESAVADLVSERLHLPCSQFNAASQLGFAGESISSAAAAIAAAGLAVAALDPEGLPFDFLHPKRPAAPRKPGRLRWLAAATAATILLVTLLGVRSHLLQEKAQEKAAVQASVIAAEKLRPEYRRMQLYAKTVRDWAAERVDWLDHYAYISSRLPPNTEIYATSFSTGNRGIIRISVQARSNDALAELDSRLRQAGYQLRPLAVNPTSDKFGYPFQTTVELTIPPSMKITPEQLGAPSSSTPAEGSENAPATESPNT